MITMTGRIVETDLRDRIEKLWAEEVIEKQYNFLLETAKGITPMQWSEKYDRYDKNQKSLHQDLINFYPMGR